MAAEPKLVKDWSAKRAGAGITLTGTSNGTPVRQPDVKTIRLERGIVVAETKDGTVFHLSTGT